MPGQRFLNVDLIRLTRFYDDMLGAKLWRNSPPLSDRLAMELLRNCLIVVCYALASMTGRNRFSEFGTLCWVTLLIYQLKFVGSYLLEYTYIFENDFRRWQ